MPSLRIVKPGLLTTVQDRGRSGWEAYGVPQGGARDLRAYLWANRLAANPPGAAVLEAVLLGPTVSVTEPCWLATAGAAAVTVDGSKRPGWAGFWVRAGAAVSLERLVGARAYLAVHGGIDVEPVLGSRSTDLESGFGGHEGRALRAGDVLRIGAADGAPYAGREVLRHPRPPEPRSPLTVRAVRGPRDGDFPEEARNALFAADYIVSSRSNHVGLRLDGPPIPTSSRGGRISEPMPVGGVQVTPAGQAVILLNARGTIGGYPLLATVCTPELWLLGQARPNDTVRFELVSVELAQAIAREAFHALLAEQPVRDLLPPPERGEQRRSGG
ncbi:MAG: biotin-dependent carboxyltransferase family protein [Chloroflexi bacterium]|nr:biotin-dependent carboxyltransferase family protein [Chloroflexota bacterium]